MMAAIGERIDAAPEGPDVTAISVRREHLQEAIDELLAAAVRVEHE